MSAPTPVVNGTSGAYLQPAERGNDSTGPYRVLRYEGTRNAMRAKELTLGLAPYSYKESFSGAKDVIEVRLASGQVDGVEAPQIIWEVRWSPVEKDILRSEAALALSDKERKVLRSYIANPEKFEFKSPAITSDAGLQIYETIKSGETSVRQFVPTLTRTITMATPSLAFVAVQNLGKIFRTPSLYGGEGLLPSDFVFPLPNAVDPPSVIDPDVGVAIRRHFGWMKSQMDGTRTAYQKTAVVQGYEYGLWPEVIYGMPL